ncbi:hypothetical protein [Mycolicibacterium farcinogenes]|uniref:Uncharacterized protein n=1 Tax=Mycolicibacterium farcinogenes TaxID=1802 RepID=A0ACD1FR44_MYCFR|nr:hypothetical protein [Mycolicibacterium farcinogenes]QZH69524.1 hypothetical protein K6L26_31370 [Mycolicibacterium farcinogenes]
MWKVLLSIFIFGAIAGPLIALVLGAVTVLIVMVVSVVGAVCALMWAGTKGVWRWAGAQPISATDSARRDVPAEDVPLVGPRYRGAELADMPGPDASGKDADESIFEQYRRRHPGGGVGRALVLDTRAYPKTP